MVKIKYRHWAFRLPLLRHYRGICLGRTILFKHGEEDISQTLLRHELAHQEQIAREGMLRFYAVYLRDYFRNLARYKSHWAAYRNIPFEVEARAAEETLSPAAKRDDP